jgi:hypothetical protein
MEGNLTLDPQIRNWVVIPLIVITVFVGIGRRWLMQLLRPGAKKLDKDESTHRQMLGRAQKFRLNGKLLPPSSFASRKAYFTKKGTGLLRKEVPAAGNPMMSNPSSMFDMMKGQVTFMVQNMLMMNFVGYLFSGFVLVKVPFSLTDRFKSMLQKDVNLTTLDASYVSSVSWYFLVMFGLNSLFQVIMGDDTGAMDESRMMQMQMGGGMMGGGMGGGPMGFDAKKAFKAERDAIASVAYAWSGESMAHEKALLGPEFTLSRGSKNLGF